MTVGNRKLLGTKEAGLGPPRRSSASMTNLPLSTRSWNGTPIQRRATDGYVNATAMAKANGKEWFDYFKSDRASTYLEALSRNLQTEVASLYEARPGSGTWIHPRLSVDFARWISAEFAVWMDGWFLEEVEQLARPQSEPVAQALPASAEIIEIVKGHALIFDLLKDRSLMNDVLEIEFQRSMINCSRRLDQAMGMLPGVANPLLPAALPRFQGKAVDLQIPVTVVEFAASYLNSQECSVVEKYDQEVGREVVRLFRERHGDEPLTTDHISVADQRNQGGFALWGQSKRGFRCKPKVYFPRDWDLVVRGLKNKGMLTPERTAELLADAQQFRCDPEKPDDFVVA